MEIEEKATKKSKEVITFKELKVPKDNGYEVINCKLCYNKCQLFYGWQTSTFKVAPWNDTLNRYEQPQEDGYTKLIGQSIPVKEIQKFTDIIDALKQLLGKDVFTRVRIEGLWCAFMGNHDAFWHRYKQYFYN